LAKTKKNKSKGKKGPYTGLAGHTRIKSRLVTPINSLNRLQMIDWFRDLLPEHLWIDLLAQRLGESGCLPMFNRLLDRLQAAAGDAPVFHGYISEFGLFPEEKRAAFMGTNADLVKEGFFEPAGCFLAGYPGFPAAWLCAPFVSDAKAPDAEEIADVLTRSVTRLAPGKNAYVGHLRILPFSRKVRAKKFSVAAGSPHLDLMSRYPAACSDDEKRRVQQFAALTMNATMFEQYASFPWAALFWRHNHQIVACQPLGFTISAGAFLDEAETERLLEVAGRNAEKAFHYLKTLVDAYKCDLFAPERDEILLGLFSRLTRLFFKVCTDSSLWAQDMAGILLRCLAETGIVFAYLSRNGTPEEFAAFRSYGEGKQKLLMLHLQDTYSGLQSLQGKSLLGFRQPPHAGLVDCGFPSGGLAHLERRQPQARQPSLRRTQDTCDHLGRNRERLGYFQPRMGSLAAGRRVCRIPIWKLAGLDAVGWRWEGGTSCGR
jgi:hypothetical protein